MFRSGLAFFGPGRFGMIKPVDPTDPRFIVLHDTSQPWITLARDWKPKGLCPK